MTLEHFKVLLDQHDWYYYMSDDANAYHRGSKERDEIQRALRECDDYEGALALYEEYCAKLKYQYPPPILTFILVLGVPFPLC